MSHHAVFAEADASTEAAALGSLSEYLRQAAVKPATFGGKAIPVSGYPTGSTIAASTTSTAEAMTYAAIRDLSEEVANLRRAVAILCRIMGATDDTDPS